jgi:hypothetical protein
MREVDGIPCLTRADFDDAAARRPVAAGPDATPFVACLQCGGRLMFVEYLPRRKVLTLRCGQCSAPATSPILLEVAAAPPEASRIIS